MIDWFNGLESGLQAVLTASWQAAVLAVIVLATQSAMGRWLSPRWRYALWSVVVIRLMMPMAPGSALSVFNLFKSDPAPAVVVAPLPPTPTIGEITYSLDTSGPSVTALASVPSWGMDDIMLAVWLAGLVLIFSVIIAINLALTLRLRRRTAITDPDLLDLVESCKQEMGVRRNVHLYDDPRIASPALAGVFRPSLLIPPGLLADLPRQELRFILLHELAHVKKHDIAQNWLLIALSAVHWFNPIVWFAFARLRADRELARDAMVLSTTGTDANQAYGQTIIHTLERITHPRLNNPALAGIGDGLGQLKRRLRMIALAPKRRPALTLTGIVLLATLAAIGLTDAAEPEAAVISERASTQTIEEVEEPEAEVEIDKSPTARSIPHAIDSPAPVHFYENRLVSAIEYLRNATGANIYVNWSALSDQGITPETKFTLEMQGEGVTGRAALSRILEVVSTDATERVIFGIREGVVIVSTLTDMVATQVSYPIEIPTEDHDREATTAALRKLSQPIPIQFERNDLVHVIRYFSKRTGVDVSVNWQALEKAGVDQGTSITLTLKDVSASEALRLILHQLAYDTPADRIEFRVIDGIITISTASDLPKPPTMEEVRAEIDRLVAEKFRQPIGVELTNAPMDRVLNMFRDVWGVPVFANWPMLKQAGIDAQTQVTLSLPDMPGDQVLRLVLKQASGKQGLNAPSWNIIDGVVNISIKRDFMTTDTRVYDIRHLLAVDHEPPPLAPRADGTISERPAKKKPSREELVGQIADLIRETVGYYEEWEAHGGGISSVSELKGNLIVKTSPDNHENITNLLAMLGEARSVQISFESQFLLVPERFFEASGLGMELSQTPDGDHIAFLDDLEVGIITKAIRNNPSARTLATPRVMLLNGQGADILIGERVSYLAEYNRVEGENGTEYKPVHLFLNDGVMLETEATVSADRRYVSATLHPTVINTAHPTEKHLWDNSPPDQDLYVEVPKFTKVEKEITVSIPDKGTLLIDVGTVSGPMSSHDPVEEGVERRVYMLVKPTIIIVTPNAKQFPGLLDE